MGLVVLLCASCKSSEPTMSGENELPEKEGMAAGLPYNEASLLWQIWKRGSDTPPSYLYGTIHIISSADFFMGSNVQEKLELSDRLVMELDFDDMDLAAMAMSGLLPDNTTIMDYLSEDDYEFVVQMFSDSIGLSRTQFEGVYGRMKPLFLQQLIVYKFLGENPMSYENDFNETAGTNNIETLGFETFKEQLDFLDQLPLEEQFEDLLEALRNWNETKRQFAELVSAYRSQDLEALNQLIEVEMENPKMVELLLDKRNKNWIPKFIEWIEMGNSFFAVGAGHLGGQYGVINLLREAGYEVWPHPIGDIIE